MNPESEPNFAPQPPPEAQPLSLRVRDNYAVALDEVASLRSLAQVVQAQGFEAYVIGGFVRDWLMDRHGNRHDIDVVTVGSGIALAQAFADAIGADEVVTYPNFGTAMVRAGQLHIEFVGARRESYRADSRKPIVEDGTLHDDQLRRDFTINALSFSLNAADYGQLHDPFGGLGDLAQRRIVTPTDPVVTFGDDPLRMLRAIRFAAVLGFQIDPQTLAAIHSQADRIQIISPERIADELNKIILAPKPSVGFRLLFQTGLLAHIFPELQAMQGVDRRDAHSHKDNFYHTIQVLDNICPSTDDLWLRWAAILHDIGKPRTKRYHPQHGWTFHGHEDVGARMVPKIFRRMRLPLNHKMDYVQKLVRLHQRPIALVDDGVSDSAIRRLVFEAGDDLDDLFRLCRADVTTRDKRRAARYIENFDQVQARIAEVEELDRLRSWQPPLSGEDIMAIYGLRPGPQVGVLKNAIRDAILDGEIPNSREAAEAFLHQHADRLLIQTAPPHRKPNPPAP
jgi:putative nucleotidyltransferase with HDIG domain